LDENELTVFFKLEPERIQRLVFNPNLKPAAAAAEFLQKYDRNRDGRLQRDELVMEMRNRPFFASQPALYQTNFPGLKRTQITNQ
jgi:hypothetical protein